MLELQVNLGSWFHQHLREVLARRNLSTKPETEDYLVTLLCRWGTEAPPDHSMTLLFAEAQWEEDPAVRFKKFRDLGDDALCMSGFFAEHFECKGVGSDFVDQLGGNAYRLAFGESHRVPEKERGTPIVYAELSAKFSRVAHALDELRDATTLRTPQDIVRLYDSWRRTRSPRLAAKLAKQGVFPSQDVDGDHIH